MILPGLKSCNLISLGRLCNDDFLVALTKKKLYTIKNGRTVLTGYRNWSDGLWDIPLPVPTTMLPTPKLSLHKGFSLFTTQHKKIVPTLSAPLQCPQPTSIQGQSHFPMQSSHLPVQDHKIHVIIRKQQPARELIRYLHAACFSPVPST